MSGPEAGSVLIERYAAGERDFERESFNGLAAIGANLTEARFAGADFTGAELTDASLIEVDMTGARATRARFRQAKLWAATLDRANLVAADLTGASLVGASLKAADLEDAKLVSANLSGANLLQARLVRATLVGGDLGGANLLGVTLQGALAMEADLSNAKLWDADLEDADLRNASLVGASMIGARLTRTNLAGADLRGLDLSNAVLAGARIQGDADVLGSASGCRIDAATYVASGWTPEQLSQWIDAGAELQDRAGFPPEALEEAHRRAEGLTLYFDGPLEGFDRLLVDSVVFAVLGRGTACYPAEVAAFEARALVRLAGVTPVELAHVADAIEGRVWTSGGALELDSLLRIPEVYEGLESLRGRILRMELRGPDPTQHPTDPGLVLDEGATLELAADEISGHPASPNAAVQVWHLRTAGG